MDFFIHNAIFWGEWFIGVALSFMMALTVIVFFHELGHFLVARWNRVDVDVFSIGFGPELIGFTDRHGTRWKFCPILLGGYVKFSGDSNLASMPDDEAIEHIHAQAKPGSLAHKRLWQKALIVAAGPVANFILAIIIFTGIKLSFGQMITDPIITEVLKNGAAYEAGFEAGDRILSVDDVPMESFSDIGRYVSSRPGQTMDFKIEREGEMIHLQATSQLRETSDSFGNKQKIGMIGIRSDLAQSNVQIRRFGFFEALTSSINDSWYVVETTFRFLRDAIAGRQDITQLSGPLGIAKMSNDFAKAGVVNFIHFIGFLSVSIGLINLFPIPILDGGHLMFYAIEAIRGRPVNAKIQKIAYNIGMITIFALMIFAFKNDLTN